VAKVDPWKARLDLVERFASAPPAPSTWTGAFEKDAAAFPAVPEKTIASTRLLSIRVGDEDFALPGCRNLSELLKRHQVEHELVVNGGGHTWINWRLYLSELLPRLFR
jgi:enterochelin esterase family protein